MIAFKGDIYFFRDDCEWPTQNQNLLQQQKNATGRNLLFSCFRNGRSEHTQSGSSKNVVEAPHVDQADKGLHLMPRGRKARHRTSAQGCRGPITPIGVTRAVRLCACITDFGHDLSKRLAAARRTGKHLTVLSVSLECAAANSGIVMSRGPGRIEKAIEAAFTASPHQAFTVEQLVRIAYPQDYSGDSYNEHIAYLAATKQRVPRLPKKHRVAVLRAARNVAKRCDWVAVQRRYHWQENGRWNASVLTIFANALDLASYSAAQAFGARCEPEKHLAEPGGEWWVTVELAKARKAGDAVKADALQAQLRDIEDEARKAHGRYMAPMVAYYAEKRAAEAASRLRTQKLFDRHRGS